MQITTTVEYILKPISQPSFHENFQSQCISCFIIHSRFFAHNTLNSRSSTEYRGVEYYGLEGLGCVQASEGPSPVSMQPRLDDTYYQSPPILCLSYPFAISLCNYIMNPILTECLYTAKQLWPKYNKICKSRFLQFKYWCVICEHLWCV